VSHPINHLAKDLNSIKVRSLFSGLVLVVIWAEKTRMPTRKQKKATNKKKAVEKMRNP